MTKQMIHSEQAPKAIGTYSQAIRVGNTVYLSGQLPLDPISMQLLDGDFVSQTRQIFANLQAVAKAAGGDLNHIVRLGIYLTDLAYFPQVNEVMAEYFATPYPARSTIGVAALPKGAVIEIDAVMVI